MAVYCVALRIRTGMVTTVPATVCRETVITPI
jgi:hypothetical protein